MGISLRQHVISLAAVFVALALGILVGVSLSRQETLEGKMNKLSAQFSTLNDENRRLSERIELSDDEMRARAEFDLPFLGPMVAQRLAGVPIALVWYGDLEGVAFEADLATTLASAGAGVVANISFAPDFRTLVGRVDLSQILSVESSPEERPQEVARQLGMLAAAGRWAELERFADLRLITVSGPRGAPPAALILVAQAPEPNGADSKQDGAAADAGDVPAAVLDGARASGVYLLCAETAHSPMSHIALFRRVATATVDNVETIPGQVAVVYAVSRRLKGDFGVKKTAQSLLPRAE